MGVLKVRLRTETPDYAYTGGPKDFGQLVEWIREVPLPAKLTAHARHLRLQKIVIGEDPIALAMKFIQEIQQGEYHEDRDSRKWDDTPQGGVQPGRDGD